jgi:alanine racemase
MRFRSGDAPFHGGRLEIDLGALRANWLQLARLSGPAECGAVVKADGYGLGIETIVPALLKAGCRTFFVAHLSEAVRVRAVARAATIYVLNGLPPGAGPAYQPDDLRPVLGSPEEVAEWAMVGREVGRALPAALHVDTGMNRLGMSLDQARAFAAQGEVAGLAPSLLMTHFVESETPRAQSNANQIAAFAQACALFPDMPASLCNSSGIFLPDAPRGALTRPGYALYGGNPTPGLPNPMQPVVHLTGLVLQTRAVPAGSFAGYAGQWQAKRDSVLATVSVGYADGYPRTGSGIMAREALGQDSEIGLIDGQVCPQVGLISMDLLIFDVTDVPGVTRGDAITLIGDGLSVDEVGRRAGTNGYEILTSLGRRYARVIRDGSET